MPLVAVLISKGHFHCDCDDNTNILPYKMLLMELFGRQSNFIRKVQGVTVPCKHIKSRFPLLACSYSSRLSMCHLFLAINTMVNIFFLCAVSQSEDEWCTSQCVRPMNVCVGACLFMCIS